MTVSRYLVELLALEDERTRTTNIVIHSTESLSHTQEEVHPRKTQSADHVTGTVYNYLCVQRKRDTIRVSGLVPETEVHHCENVNGDCQIK